MAKIPKKVIDRLTNTIKPFQTVAMSHKMKDVSEADTVTLIKDVLAEIIKDRRVKNMQLEIFDEKIKVLEERKERTLQLEKDFGIGDGN